MSDNANAIEKKETKAEEPKVKVDKVITPPKDWQKAMWEGYNDNYAKQLSDHCYDHSFNVKYNAIESKTQEQLLFSEPKWIDAKLILKKLSTVQTDHCDTLKTDWIQAIRNAAMSPEEYEAAKIPVPENYGILNIERKKLEKQYYEEATRIMFKIKIGDEAAREITIEDYNRLERVHAKFAVDAVHLSFAKPEPKNDEASSSLYT